MGAQAAQLRAAAARQAASWWRWLAEQLGDAEWFGGAAFGRADLSVIPYLNGSAGFGLESAPPTAAPDAE